ncbi:MAG TPA: CHAT domain-containing protein, partial [Thermoanaerobaculia bacterium]
RTTTFRVTEAELDRSIDACRAQSDQFRLSRLSFARAGLRAQAGSVEAIGDYDAAIAALSRVDATGIADLRTWREGMRQSLDEAIRFAIKSGRDADALRWIVLIRSHGSISHPPNDQTVALVYWALSDCICSWVIRPSGVFFHAEPFSRPSLARMAQAAREDQGAAADLYDTLLRPLEGDLRGATDLVIFADELFSGVPFAALYDRRRHNYVVEHFDVRSARTLSLAKTPVPSNSWTPLIVADPAFDATVLPDLPRLPGAIAEAKAIKESFPRARILTGTGATVDIVEQAAPQYGVLHVAAHAIGGDAAMTPSAVVLASDSARSGLLYASEIRAKIFGCFHLVVISACRSAADGKGDISDIAEALLAAGVPSVIGSVSDVADAQSAEFYGDFYRVLALTKDPAAAFRRAQLDDIRRHSSTWKNYMMFTAGWPANEREETSR